jgi:hypothetical protein
MVGACWTAASIARMVSVALLILIAMVVIGEGLPDVREFSTGEQVSSVMFVAMLVGLVVGWWRELPGAVLILVGFVTFVASEYVSSGDAGMNWIFMLFPVAGMLFLAYWWLTRKR